MVGEGLSEGSLTLNSGLTAPGATQDKLARTAFVKQRVGGCHITPGLTLCAPLCVLGEEGLASKTKPSQVDRLIYVPMVCTPSNEMQGENFCLWF